MAKRFEFESDFVSLEDHFSLSFEPDYTFDLSENLVATTLPDFTYYKLSPEFHSKASPVFATAPAAAFELSSLLAVNGGNGSLGTVFAHTNDFDDFGGYLSSGGDINGDGFDDFLIGASFGSTNGSYSGESYVIFGTSTGFNAEVSLASLDGTNGFVINGIEALDRSGESLSSAGDINGDGFDDIIIGAAFADNGGANLAGQSYVIFGAESGFGASFELSALNGTNGFVIFGIDRTDLSGVSVSSAGDFNGDGFDDILIGASGGDSSDGTEGVGEAYVVFGDHSGFGASLELADLDGSNGFVLNGIDMNDYSGRRVSDAGDMNGDGFDDIIIGAPSATPNGTRSGESYVVFGTDAAFPTDLDLATLDGTNGFVINGIDVNDSSNRFDSGHSSGDFNGDGFDDIVLSAVYADPNGSRSGESYVIFGKSTGFTASLELSALNGVNGLKLMVLMPMT